MSTSSPPAPEVASMTTRASSSMSSGRAIDVATPVEVSLCGQASTSAASSPEVASAGEGTRGAEARAAGLGIADVPGSAASTSEDSRWGAPSVAFANVGPNSPKVACAARRRTRPKAATSQNTVDPPFPSTTSKTADPRCSGTSPPEHRGSAVSEHHLVAFGQVEQIGQAGADAADEVLHRILAVAGAEHRRRGLVECLDLGGADEGRAVPEATVGGQEFVGDG